MRELIKFFAGVTFWEFVVHVTLAVSDQLPITLLGFTITPEINLVQIIVPGIASLILIYVGWFNKEIWK